MRMTTHRGLGAVAAGAMLLLAGGIAGAQEADLRGQVEDLLQRYEEAIAAGDFGAVASLYTENAVYSPMTGGLIEGREGVQGFYEEAKPTSLDLRSARTEAIGEAAVLDIGTFTVMLPGEGGEMEVEGEYVAVVEAGEDGPQIRSVSTFPMRQAQE